MFKKHAPLLFLVLSCISIKISSDATVHIQRLEHKTFDFPGLKIQSSDRQPASIATQTLQPQPNKNVPLSVLPTCTKIKKLNDYENSFLSQNQEALRKALGPWHFEKPETIDYDHSLFTGMSETALYVSSLYAMKKVLSEKDKTDSKRYMPVSMLYQLFFKNRANSETLFYIYDFYRKIKVDDSVLDYVRTKLQESSEHIALNKQVYKEVFKLVKDSESLIGAYQFLKKFNGLSAHEYKVTLLEMEKDSRIDLAKKLIKNGTDKTSVNKHLEWNPSAYKAAYEVLQSEDMVRSYLPLKELEEEKSKSNRSFMDKLAAVKNDCDLKEVWEIAAPIIREL